MNVPRPPAGVGWPVRAQWIPTIFASLLWPRGAPYQVAADPDKRLSGFSGGSACPHASAVLPKEIGFEVDAFLSELIFPPNEADRLVREVVAFSAERVAVPEQMNTACVKSIGSLKLMFFRMEMMSPVFKPSCACRPLILSVRAASASRPRLNQCPP